ncbi:MAG: hypothetical protein WC202_03755 [Desulfobacterales bacterium]|jgi:hypothetical protein
MSESLKLDNNAHCNLLLRPFYKLFVIFFCVSLVILVVFDWIEFYLTTELVAKRNLRAFLFIVFLIGVIDPTLSQKGRRFFLSFPLIALGYLFFTYALFEADMADGLYYATRIIYWILGTFFVYKMLLAQYLTQKHIVAVIYAVVCIYSVMVFYFMFNPAIRFTQNLSIYVLLWCVPFLLIQKRTNFNKIFLCLSIVSIFLCFKRGASLALILSTFIYLFFYFLQNRSFKTGFKLSFIFLGFLLILMSALIVINETRPDFFEKRTSDITDKDRVGSGRGGFYRGVLNSYFQSFYSEPAKFFFGHGSRSVQKRTAGFLGGNGVYAHSDWLQIMPDYGLLGVLILMWLHFSIIRIVYIGMQTKNQMAPALAMTYTIFFLSSIYSGQIFIPNTIYFGIFISFYYVNCSENRRANFSFPDVRGGTG